MPSSSKNVDISDDDDYGDIGRKALDLNGPLIKPNWQSENVAEMDADAYLRRVAYERQYMCEDTIYMEEEENQDHMETDDSNDVVDASNNDQSSTVV